MRAGCCERWEGGIDLVARDIEVALRPLGTFFGGGGGKAASQRAGGDRRDQRRLTTLVSVNVERASWRRSQREGRRQTTVDETAGGRLAVGRSCENRAARPRHGHTDYMGAVIRLLALLCSALLCFALGCESLSKSQKCNVACCFTLADD